jgi:hypothetical protein
MSSDFTWTDGNYLSQLLGISPLMDGNKLRIWYWGYDLAEVSPTDTTYHVHSVDSHLHPDIGHWGIGTSEYVFSEMANLSEEDKTDATITIDYHGKKGTIRTDNSLQSIINIYSVNGQLLYQNTFINSLDFTIEYDGLILINVSNEYSVFTKKFISHN